MEFDPNNKVIMLCAQGMDLESKGQPDGASQLFQQAWNAAENDFEKFTAAHYVARHQPTTADKLKWDETALNLALSMNDDTVKANYPSLYLNIAKCHEDLDDIENAGKNYQLALSFANQLPDDGYGNMIKAGITNGLRRISNPSI
jgi:rifampin ADP-ribosylating transferase